MAEDRSIKEIRMICPKCLEYMKGMKEIVEQRNFCNLQSAAPKYTSRPFAFCPYCGARLAARG